MPSPDVTPYVDLSLGARTRQAIFDAMLGAAVLRFPDWDPLEAHTETQLLEVFAEQVEELEQQFAGIGAAVFEGVLRLLGIFRDPGTRPTGTVTIVIADASGMTIPAGTRLRYTPTDGADPADLVTSEDTLYDVGVTSLPVTVVGTTETTALNGQTGGAVQVVDAVPSIDSLTLTGSLTGGRDPEDSNSYLSRGALRLARLTTTLVQAKQFELAALEDPDVVRAVGIDDFNSDAGSGAPGDHPGHVTIATAGPGGAPLSGGQKTDLLAALSVEKFGPLILHAADSTVTAVDVTAELQRLAAYTDAEVKANAEAALNAYLDPGSWDYSDTTVYRNDLIGLLKQVEGVRHVITLSSPAADVALTGVAPLADLGTPDITTVP